MVKAAGETGVGMIKDLVSTITLYKLRKLLYDINYFKGKRKRKLEGTEINRSDSEDS